MRPLLLQLVRFEVEEVHAGVTLVRQVEVVPVLGLQAFGQLIEDFSSRYWHCYILHSAEGDCPNSSVAELRCQGQYVEVLRCHFFQSKDVLTKRFT